MKIKPKFIWDKTGVAICRITDPDTGKILTGVAKCHPEDKDMMSEKTGLEIAYHRALVQLYKNKIKTLKKEKRTTEDIYKTFKNMPDFNKENRYIRVVRHRIYGLNEEIKFYDALINNTINYIKYFINNKDTFYKITRAKRKEDKEFKQEV